MNANAATVTGYIASTDPTFSGTWIKPYPADGIATVDLSGATGSAASQSIYLKYVSMTGHQSDVMSRPFSKTGAGAASTAKSPNEKMKFTHSLSLGMQGTDVAALQSFLEKEQLLVMPKNTARGYFGEMTKTAVGKFQIKHKIVASSKSSGYGTVGPMTRKAMQ